MAVPNVNIQQKKESITMNKLRVLTFLHPKDHDGLSRKVRTVDNIPKILTIVANDKKSKKILEKMSSKLHLQDGKVIKEMDEDDSKNNMDSSDEDDDDSSIDGDLEDDEQKMYE